MSYDLDELERLYDYYVGLPRKPALPMYEAHQRLMDALLDAFPAMAHDLREAKP